ncbi:hypothetical protein GALMADRAFT_835706 [Galerina marginata CBS 339.88]|uniref:Methyltransferase domain-containing protein n=1 Tax=Galerina marginata (strain CBS 339.88) TaxID=685588 RepID=A0A067TRT9_GALM3|nr:hypothetical protein GALMADRAFT_835706 [Galerina marginata CBS 339.88]
MSNMSPVPDESDPLTSPRALQLLATHPNTQPAPSLRADVLHLVCLYSAAAIPAPDIPADLAHLITAIRAVQLPRAPIPLHAPPLPSPGMSPKKAHEVARMAAYTVRLAAHLPEHTLRIVDIGAGQGYLTRALKAHLPLAHILALDADTEQTRGAQRWEQRLLPDADPPIAHRVIFISPKSLLSTIDDWANHDGPGPVPVLFVALHACGSLTPDVLRAFIAATKNPSSNWYPAGLVAVGCCYNLMNPSDYPPSTRHLPISAYQLAAQIPSQWLLPTDPPTLDPAVTLSIRKVTWRALLATAIENAIPAPITSTSTPTKKSATVPARWSRSPDQDPAYQAPESGTSDSPAMHRLGRLRDSAYASWNTFLRAAEVKLGLRFREDAFDPEGENEIEGTDGKPRGRDKSLENSLAVLHVMRCLLGPAIESAILRDRLHWVRQELGINSTQTSDQNQNTPKLRAELVNLFDQATGSGRNVAIVVTPSASFPEFQSPSA